MRIVLDKLTVREVIHLPPKKTDITYMSLGRAKVGCLSTEKMEDPNTDKNFSTVQDLSIVGNLGTVKDLITVDHPGTMKNFNTVQKSFIRMSHIFSHHYKFSTSVEVRVLIFS